MRMIGMRSHPFVALVLLLPVLSLAQQTGSGFGNARLSLDDPRAPASTAGASAPPVLEAPAAAVCARDFETEQLARARLALADNDLERWSVALARLINAGCEGPALEQALSEASQRDATSLAARDEAMFAAARKSRPTIFDESELARRQDQSAETWTGVASFLVDVLEARKEAREQ